MSPQATERLACQGLCLSGPAGPLSSGAPDYTRAQNKDLVRFYSTEMKVMEDTDVP